MATYTNAERSAFYLRKAVKMDKLGNDRLAKAFFAKATFFANRTGVKNVRGRMPPSRRQW